MVTTIENTITAMPTALRSIGCGLISRLPTSNSRNRDEPAMKVDWPRPASGSALPWPKRCSRSAGCSAVRTAIRLTIEAAASSIESSSVDSTLTESVET